jgi:hypothetical protein
MRVLVLALALIATTATAQTDPPPESPLFRALGTTLIVLNGADVAQTSYMMGTGRFYEMNPIVAPIADHPVWLATVNVAYAQGINWATAKLYATHPRWALVLRIAAVGAQGWCVAWNAVHIRRYGR